MLGSTALNGGQLLDAAVGFENFEGWNSGGFGARLLERAESDTRLSLTDRAGEKGGGDVDFITAEAFEQRGQQIDLGEPAAGCGDTAGGLHQFSKQHTTKVACQRDRFGGFFTEVYMSHGRKNRFTIGRERKCDIPIADESVSRLHAELTVLEGGSLFLTDCHSSNGTTLLRDGTPRRISQEMVLPTDRVQFGDVVLSMADIVDSLRGRMPASASSSATPQRRELAPGGRVERCHCGAIKPEGKSCPACGA